MFKIELKKDCHIVLAETREFVSSVTRKAFGVLPAFEDDFGNRGFDHLIVPNLIDGDHPGTDEGVEMLFGNAEEDGKMCGADVS